VVGAADNFQTERMISWDLTFSEVFLLVFSQRH